MPRFLLMPLPAEVAACSPFLRVRAEYGYIVWRRGTGDNVELTHIRSARQFGGRRLLRAMLRVLGENPPYGGEGTVYGFTREGNLKARHWYADMGFDLTAVVGVYAEGSAVVFSAPYKVLTGIHLGDD